MELSLPPRILTAERLKDGVVLQFDDGRCAFYPHALLYDVLAWAEERNETTVDW